MTALDLPTSDRTTPAASAPRRRLVLVVRADPVICGHSVEARNLAEAALDRGFDDVRIVTWSVDHLAELGLPLKPRVEPYSPGITVERPAPVGGYKVPDGRHTAAMVGRLVELFTDGVPTVAMSLYLLPHAMVVEEALRTARASGLPVDVATIHEVVGSDVTHIVRDAVDSGSLGVAAQLFATYLSGDVCVAVSDYTREQVIACAEEVDDRLGTRFAAACRERIEVSYPAIDTAAYTQLDPEATRAALTTRGLDRDGYVLFLSRLTPAKGVDDLLEGYARSGLAARWPLVVAGTGPIRQQLQAVAAGLDAADRIVFLDDVSDAEKPHLMAGCAAYVLPSKPLPEFTETFGIALAEVMLAGGGPVLTTTTGGIPEAVGGTALTIGAAAPDDIAERLRHVASMTGADRAAHVDRARQHALGFDRAVVLDRLLRLVDAAGEPISEAA